MIKLLQSERRLSVILLLRRILTNHITLELIDKGYTIKWLFLGMNARLCHEKSVLKSLDPSSRFNF